MEIFWGSLFTALLVGGAGAWPLDLVQDAEDLGSQVTQNLLRDSAAVTNIGRPVGAIDCDAVDVWLQDLKGKDLPDVSGQKHEWFGTVKYQVTHLKINSLSNATCDIQLHFLTVTVNLDKLTIGAHGDWHYKVGGIQDSGSLDVKVAEIKAQINVTDRSDTAAGQPFQSNGLGSPHVTCHVTIGGLAISLHGGASFLYKPIVDKMVPSIKKAIESKICGMV